MIPASQTRERRVVRLGRGLLGSAVARGPGERGDARAMVVRAVQARWRAGRLGRSGAARLEHGDVGARWPAQGHGAEGMVLRARLRRRRLGLGG